MTAARSAVCVQSEQAVEDEVAKDEVVEDKEVEVVEDEVVEDEEGVEVEDEVVNDAKDSFRMRWRW